MRSKAIKEETHTQEVETGRDFLGGGEQQARMTAGLDTAGAPYLVL